MTSRFFFTCQLEFNTLNNNNNLKSIGREEKTVMECEASQHKWIWGWCSTEFLQEAQTETCTCQAGGEGQVFPRVEGLI